MKPTRVRYEILVERHLSPATLATFPVALTMTAVRRNRVRRLRVPADRDLVDVVRRLTDRRVQLLEIRRCPAPGEGRPRPAAPRVVASPVLGGGDLVAFPPPDPAAAQAPCRRCDATVTELVSPDRGGADARAAGTMPGRAPARRLPRRRASAERVRADRKDDRR